MYLSHLALSDFRNYREAIVEFEPGVNVLIGSNGQGKTNLVEAIAYLATFQSHRVAADAALVRVGKQGAVVRAKVTGGGRATTLELEIIAGRANQARRNRHPVPPRELLGVLRVVVFAPEDLMLVKGDPAERRRFLDELMVMRTPRLAGAKSDYDKILRQRAALLKQAGGRGRGRGRPDEYTESTLDVWDAQLADAGAQLVVARAQLVADLAGHVTSAYSAISGSPQGATVTLDSSLERREAQFSDDGPPPPPPDSLPAVDSARERLLHAMRVLRPAELERGVCLVGPHRDDLTVLIGDLPAKGFASHGESWSAALALRLAAFELLRADDPDPPVLILDDVFAELDLARRSQLALMVGVADQVFVTAAVAADVPAELGGTRYVVSDGTIARAGTAGVRDAGAGVGA